MAVAPLAELAKTHLERGMRQRRQKSAYGERRGERMPSADGTESITYLLGPPPPLLSPPLHQCWAGCKSRLSRARVPLKPMRRSSWGGPAKRYCKHGLVCTTYPPLRAACLSACPACYTNTVSGRPLTTSRTNVPILTGWAPRRLCHQRALDRDCGRVCVLPPLLADSP